MTHSDAQSNCVLYLSDVHGEFDTFAYLLDGWRDDLRWAHLVGDVYDRGPAPDKIIDLLMAYPDADIQWVLRSDSLVALPMLCVTVHAMAI